MSRNRLFGLPLLLTALALLLAACGGQTPAAPAEPQVVTQVVVQTEVVERPVEVVVTPTPGPHPEAVIDGVEEGAEITFWTFYLSPTFDEYIQNTIARFNEAYPGVTVKWEDRQATLQEEYRNSLAAGNAPDVVNITTAWVQEFAQSGQLLNMSEALPQSVQDQYFPDLFNQINVGGASYQVPWYQAVDAYLVNTDVISAAGYTLEQMPKTFDEQKQFCLDFYAKSGIPCGLRMQTDNLLQTIAYEGGVEVMNEDGTAFTFDSPEAVQWLQDYVDMNNAGALHKDIILLNASEDRVGLERFTAAQMPFYVTGPQLVRLVRESNPGRYGYLALVPRAVGRSGALPPVSMSIVVSKNTPYPRASLALATFFTNPKSMLEFAKIVSIYPSTPESYKDPFFTQAPVAIEDQIRPIAEGIISQQKNILPEIPNQAEVNDIVRQAIEAALFGGVDPQTALSNAVEQANALLR